MPKSLLMDGLLSPAVGLPVRQPWCSVEVTLLLFLFGRSWPGVPTLQASMTGLR